MNPPPSPHPWFTETGLHGTLVLAALAFVTLAAPLRVQATASYGAKTDFMAGVVPISEVLGDLNGDLNGDGKHDLMAAPLSTPQISPSFMSLRFNHESQALHRHD